MKPVVDLAVGARPNFVKLAPVVRALASDGALAFRIVHTGQHHDDGMSEVFFRELGIPAPDVTLDISSGSHGARTARMLERYEAHLLEHRPAAAVVFGDVDSTPACALAAVKLGIPGAATSATTRWSGSGATRGWIASGKGPARSSASSSPAASPSAASRS